MSTYKTKYFKNIKKINNTFRLDKLINQLEKKQREFDHDYIYKKFNLKSIYKMKYFKNTKKINNTPWLDKLINQLEKNSKGV